MRSTENLVQRVLYITVAVVAYIGVLPAPTAYAVQPYATLISKGTQGIAEEASSFGTSTNYDGSKIAFRSYARNLDPNYSLIANPSVLSGYLYDTNTGLNKLITVGLNNSQLNENVYDMKLSRNSTKAVFATAATNAVTSQVLSGQIYVTDINGGWNTNQIASLDENNNPIGGQYFSISDDGTKIVFTSNDQNWRMRVRDLQTNTTILLPVSGVAKALSGNGRYLIYNTVFDGPLYRYDLQTGQNIAVSLDEAGSSRVAAPGEGAISYDGNRVAFISWEPVLSNHTNHCTYSQNTVISRVYVRDIGQSLTSIADVNDDGTDPISECSSSRAGAGGVVMDAAGDKVAFSHNNHIDDYQFALTYSPPFQYFVHDFTGHTTRGLTRDIDAEYSKVNAGDSSISGNGQVLSYIVNGSVNTSPPYNENQAYIVSTNFPRDPSPTSRTMTGSGTVVPSLSNNDTIPNLTSNSQVDTASFNFTAKYNALGQIDGLSRLTLSYNTGGGLCVLPIPISNCRSFNILSTSTAKLVTQGLNSTAGSFEGGGLALIDGQASSILYKLKVTDGARQTPTASDKFQLLIYQSDPSPNYINQVRPLYSINLAPISTGDITIN